MKEIRWINPDSVRIDDEFSNVFGPLDKETEEALTASLIHGFDISKGKITVWYEPGHENPVIVDGHNRFRICRNNGVTLVSNHFAEKKFADRQAVIAWILDTQLSRRNLTDVERVELTEKYRSILTARGKANMSAGGKGSTISSKVDTRKACAQMAGVGEGKYSEIRLVLDSDDDDTKQKLRSGQMSAHAAAKKIKGLNKEQTQSGGGRLRMNMRQMMQIERKIRDLNKQREKLHQESCEIVRSIDSVMGYSLMKADDCGDVVHIYLEYSGFRATIYLGEIIGDEPDESQMSECPSHRRDEFVSVWKSAKDDLESRKEYSRGQESQQGRQADHDSSDAKDDGENIARDFIRSIYQIQSIAPDFRKKVGRMIAREFHADNGHTTEESQWANKIYEFLMAV